jgi:heme-degrading monooxygenase HmoA
MIIVVVRHMLQPGMYEEARERLAVNAQRMMQQPGCIFRYTGESDEGRELVTVTGWASEEDRASWETARKAAPPPGDMADYYSGFEIIDICVFDRRDASVGALEP